MMELRTYTLKSEEALRRYTTSFWPHHIQSLRKHGITVHGVWIDATGADRHQVIALVDYGPGNNPARLAESYRSSADFVEDHADFDISQIASTQTKPLEPIASSPRRWKVSTFDYIPGRDGVAITLGTSRGSL